MSCSKDKDLFDSAIIGYWERGDTVFSVSPARYGFYAPDRTQKCSGPITFIAPGRFKIESVEFTYYFKGETLVLDGYYFKRYDF